MLCIFRYKSTKNPEQDPYKCAAKGDDEEWPAASDDVDCLDVVLSEFNESLHHMI